MNNACVSTVCVNPTVTPTAPTLVLQNRSGILQYVPPELKQLYLRLEVDFNPLELCKTVIPILDALPIPPSMTTQEEEEQSDKPYNPPLGQYVEALKEVLLVRLIKQVSQVYHSISFERLQQLAPFASVWELEKMVVEVAHKNHLQVLTDSTVCVCVHACVCACRCACVRLAVVCVCMPPFPLTHHFPSPLFIPPLPSPPLLPSPPFPLPSGPH